MPDRPNTPERDLDRELKDLANRMEYPPTPDLARTVRERLETNAAPDARRGGFWSRLPSSRWAVAAALALVFLVPAFSPAMRDTVTGIFAAQGGGGGAQSAGGAGGESGGTEEARDLPSSAAPEAETPTSGGSSAPSADSADVSGAEEGDFDRKVIKTAELGIRSRDVRGSAADAQQVASRFGGSVLSSRVGRDGGSVTADLVLSVPSSEFQEALDELRGLGVEVTTDSVSGEDVTEEFVDLESRERNLLAAEESLVRLYEESESVNDTLRVQRELTAVRGEIEQVQGRIKYLEQRAASSQINLSIRPVEDAASKTGWDPSSIAARAWNASLCVLQTAATALISVLVFSWWLAPVFVVGFVWRRRRHRGSGSAAIDSQQPR